MEQLYLEHVAGIPVAPKGFAFVSSSISLAGDALFLFVEKPAKDLVHKKKNAMFPIPKMGKGYLYKLIISDGHKSREITLPPFEFAFPLVDVFSDGSVVIAGARCEWRAQDDYDLNGMIFNAETNDTTYFLAGDGIENIGVDGDDCIWVSLFDEGIYGSFGSRRGQSDPAWRAGLNCFNASGEIVWRFDADERHIVDCYALNVTSHLTYFYYYSDFDLGTVSKGFDVRFQKTGVSGCSEFAISKKAALFTAGYRDASDVVNFVRFEEKVTPQKFRLRMPDGEAIGEGRLIGRGSVLYFFSNTGWYRLEMAMAG